MLRRLLSFIAATLVAALAFAGCGGSDDEQVAAPIESALEYLPKDAAVLAVVPTDTKSGPIKQLDDLGTSEVKKWGQIKRELLKELQEDSTGSASKQVAAYFGNPLAVAQAGPDSGNQYLALQVQDPGAVKQSAQADIAKRKARALPEYKGAFLWEDIDDAGKDDADDETNFNGLKGNVVFATDSEKQLIASIDNSEGSDNLASDNTFKKKLNEMGDGSLLRVVGDAQRLLENSKDSDAAAARKVKFVQALGVFTSKTVVTPTGLTENTTLDTTNEDLSADEMPLPTGGAPLSLPAEGGIAGAALNDPDHLIRFAETTAKQASPAGYDQYQMGIDQLKSAGGVDLHKDLLSQIEQVSAVAIANDQFEFRATLKDGVAFQEVLTKSQTFLQGALSSAADELTLNLEGSSTNPTYTLSQGSKEVARFTVDGNALVGSVGPSGALPSPTANVPIAGAQGALGIVADLSRLTSFPGLEDEIDNPLALDVLSSLGTVTTSVSETEDAITEKTQLDLTK